MRRITATIAATAMAFTAAISHAQPEDLTPEATARHLAEVGTWAFAARKNGPDGKPECVETWYFGEDGTGWVQSGEEHTTLSWVVKKGDRTDRILWRKSLTTNGEPDCMGRRSDPASYPRKETGFVIMFYNSGGALTCRPAAYVTRNGKPTGERILRDEDCWGRLDPARAD